MHASPDISDFLPRRQRRYRVPMAGSCLALVMLMFWSTDNAVFRAAAVILALGIFTAYWCRVSWPAVAAIVSAIGIAFFLPAIHVNPDSQGRVNDCRNNLRQISLAIFSYHSAHGQYPPQYTTNADGEPLLSWRVLILPYLERRDLYEQFHLDEPWDSPHNLPLVSRMPDYFRCPSAMYGETTSYLAVVGDETVWQPGIDIAHDDISERRLATALLIEDPFSAVVWTQPEDLSLANGDWRIERLLRMSNNRGHHGGLHVALTTGEIKFLSKHALTAAKLDSLFTPADYGIPR